MKKPGRKPLAQEDRKTVTLRVMVTDSVASWLNEFANANDITVSDLLRITIGEFMGKYPRGIQIVRNDKTFLKVKNLFTLRNK